MTWNELCQENGKWAAYNFDEDTHVPQWGFGEELGELCKCVIKGKQRIRGFTPEQVRTLTHDAIADMAIFFAHWCYKHHVVVGAPDKWKQYPGNHYPVSNLFRIAARIFDAEAEKADFCKLATDTLQELTNFAAACGWNLMPDVVEPVWAEVKKRDWRRFPHDGLTK